MNSREQLKVLFVEDSEDDMTLLLDALYSDYPDIHYRRVESAPSLYDALTQESWDIVISDHNLPSLNAPTALDYVNTYGQETPFIIVSGEIPESLAVTLMRNGAADMMSKDNLARLLPSVQRELTKTRTIRNLHQSQQDTKRIAYYDRLTGLPNREYLAQKATGLLEDGTRPLAILFININRFRQVSCMLGTADANRVLRDIGVRIAACIGEGNYAAHLAGDRFAVLLPDMNSDEAVIGHIEHICGKLRNPIVIEAHELYVSAHVGAAFYPRDGGNFPDLLANAETAMHQASGMHENYYRFFDHHMDALGHERAVMEYDLRRALKNGEFLLHYQPQINMFSGEVVGVEALIRWQHPARGLISPAEFIPVLEESGLILPVGEWVLREACARNRAWQQAGLPPFKMAVNLSSVQFQQPGLVPLVKRVLRETGLESRWLELEITESIAMFNEAATISTLAELQAIGLQLAIDDFGTGYSSLSYLKRFPLHKLKIDKSFVQDIHLNEEGASIVRSIISLAQNLNLKVIAEGVETEAQSQFLSNCACEEAQGYLFSKPLPEEQLLAFMNEAFATKPPSRNIPSFLRVFPTEEISGC